MITEQQAEKIIKLLERIADNTDTINSNTNKPTVLADLDTIDGKMDKLIESIENIA